MPLSDRTKRLLDWWTLHIRTNKNPSEEEKENVNSINPDDGISTNIHTSPRGEEEVNDNSSISNSSS